MNQDKTQKIRTLNLMTFAFAFSPVIYYYLGNHVIDISRNDPTKYVETKLIFICIAIICFILGILISVDKTGGIAKFINQAQQKNVDTTIDPLFIVACAFAESVCIYGLVYYFMSGQLDFLNYTVPVSILGILFIRSKFSVDSLDERLKKYAFESEEKEDE